LLRCDAVLLVQLLDNLVDNALKYGDESAQVEVLARRMGDHLVLAVRDRGPGVPLSMRQRIFEVFQRGDPNSAAGDQVSRRGAGVGLAVCRAIAKAHGGELRLRPRGHGGTAFECWLPLTAPPTGPHDPSASPTGAAP
jgi:two-component system, OmpR family, sensor histidine kinase KdpD